MQSFLLQIKVAKMYSMMTVMQLKEELRTRKASICGKKAALIERLVAYDRNANFGLEDDDRDEVYAAPATESFRDINESSYLPPLTKQHIQAFAERFQTQLKGCQMYESRFLVTARVSVDGNISYIQGKCKAQMKKITYVVNVKLNSDGSIEQSHCECAAGSGVEAHCKHVMVLLYGIENMIFINNEWVDAKSRKTFDTYNPHDGSAIAKVAEGGKADIEAAVSSAKRAFHRNSEWRLLDASQRGNILRKFAELIERDYEYLAELESYNNGMLLMMSKMLMMGASNSVRYVASLADKIQGDTIPLDGEVFTYTLKQPVGVCALILPWNVPILMFLNKVCTALAAGCTAVVKPAEQTPLTALALAALLKEAGLPAGVINVVPGFGEDAGVALTHHPDVAKISFTGSLEVGKLIQQAAGANNLKRVTLELGGKSPLIIMDDANLDLAVPAAAYGVFSLQGQMCVAASRLYVQSGIYDKFVQAAVNFLKGYKVGNPADPTSQQGPQIDEGMMKKVLGYIEKGKKEGAKLKTGGKRIGNTGFYIEPTVFADVTDDMTIAKEEIFGPVQSILKFDTLEEAVDRANATNYGLAAGIFTTNLNNALQFAKHVEAGTIWVNNYLASGVQAPFGGFKESGIGRENGLHCVDAYLEVKTVTITLPKKL